MKKSSMINIWIGSMLFGLFFGAGNLIFPVQLGQLAGSSSLVASLGFILAATGIPLLGILALAKSGYEDAFSLSSHVGIGFAFFFTTALYLTIGPFFAAPRLVSVPFEIGISSMINNQHHKVALAIFSFIFYFVALLFALKPNKLMDYIGKYLNPIFLAMLAYLILKALFHPMGDMGSANISEAYRTNVFGQGFIEGYNTMDSLAALAFGSIVISNIRSHGTLSKKGILKNTAISGCITVLLMGVIYLALVWLGATSLNIMELSDSGGLALSAISTHYLGEYGTLFFSLVVSLACLKTAIGLFSACASAFVKMFPNSLTYKQFVVVVAIITFLVSNLGLKTIINLSTPILMMLYPFAIVLIVLALIEDLFEKNKLVYQVTIAATAVAAVGDFLRYLANPLLEHSVIKSIIQLYTTYIPFYLSGFSWLVISCLGFVLGLCMYQWNGRKKTTN